MAKKKITEVLLVLLVVCAMLTGLAVTVSAASTQYSFTYYTGSDNSMGTICVLANENSYTELANSGTYGGSANQLYFLATANPGYKLVGFYYTLDNGTTQFTEGLSVDTFEAYFKKEYDAFVYWNNANSGADPHSKMIVQAVFEATQFTITATAGTGGTVSGGGVVANGGSTTITATPSTGYKFTGWYNSSNTLVSSSASYALSNVKANATYTAKFEKQSYTISVNAGTGGTVSGGGTVKYGESVTITATANPGYTFVGWYKGDTKVWSEASHTISSVNTTATYTAKFNQNAKYTITYTVDGVLRNDLTPTEYIQGIGATLPTPTKTGYTFKGWYKDPACEDGQEYGPYGNLTPAADGDRNYYGKFVPNNYTITAVAEKGGTASGSGSYAYGSAATLTATANEGYSFEGWYYNGQKLSSETGFTIASIQDNATYTAKFTKAVCKVGNTYYEKLADAIAAAANGSTITMVANTTESVEIASGKALTIDLNGFTITGVGAGNDAVGIKNLGTLTLCDGSAQKTGAVAGVGAAVHTYGTLTITGGTYTNSISSQPAIWQRDNAAGMTITGGAILGRNVAIYDDAPGSVNVIAGGVVLRANIGYDWAYVLGAYSGTGGSWTLEPGVIIKANTEGKWVKNNITVVNADNIIYEPQEKDGDYFVAKVNYEWDIKVYQTGGGIFASGDTRVKNGGSTTLVAKPDENYRFVGWYENGTLISEDLSLTVSNVTSNREFEMRFKLTQMIDEGSFEMILDSGYYGEYQAPKSGIIAFNSFFKDYETANISKFGLYLYVAGGTKVNVESTTAEELKNASGLFYTTVTDIPPEDFGTSVFAMPYVIIDDTVYYGKTESTTVKADKWLGERE